MILTSIRTQCINLNESFIHNYIHREDYVMRLKKNSVEPFLRYYRKMIKVKFRLSCTETGGEKTDVVENMRFKVY